MFWTSDCPRALSHEEELRAVECIVNVQISTPPQGPAFWDPKSEGSAGPYFPCTGALYSLYWGLIFPLLGPYIPCTGALFSMYWGLKFPA